MADGRSRCSGTPGRHSGRACRVRVAPAASRHDPLPGVPESGTPLREDARHPPGAPLPERCAAAGGQHAATGLPEAEAAGLRAFDLGTVPASVTPPRSSRRAAWFAVVTSAVVLGGMSIVATASHNRTPALEHLPSPRMPHGQPQLGLAAPKDDAPADERADRQPPPFTVVPAEPEPPTAAQSPHTPPATAHGTTAPVNAGPPAAAPPAEIPEPAEPEPAEPEPVEPGPADPDPAEPGPTPPPAPTPPSTPEPPELPELPETDDAVPTPPFPPEQGVLPSSLLPEPAAGSEGWLPEDYTAAAASP